MYGARGLLITFCVLLRKMISARVVNILFSNLKNEDGMCQY